jgi:hypothetical protein
MAGPGALDREESLEGNNKEDLNNVSGNELWISTSVGDRGESWVRWEVQMLCVGKVQGMNASCVFDANFVIRLVTRLAQTL